MTPWLLSDAYQKKSHWEVIGAGPSSCTNSGPRLEIRLQSSTRDQASKSATGCSERGAAGE
ncbi:hypothetical protein EJB05_13470 [Eragrostis curvula]|uniref:Uncharacterized protein n=1 Tax=Eragrostis curvula TaxID=38414 RepID=A0A5J9VWN8_9POAL|nr:hypothetical protein EJB05_13470 [Eragrostis curvula]